MPLIGETQFPVEFAVHRKYAKSELLLNLVWTHSHITMEIALGLLDSGRFANQDIPREVLAQACLLCEIGTYVCDGFEFINGQVPTGRPYIQHTLAGAWILKQEGYPASIIQAAYTHAKVGFTAEDIQLYGLALPLADYNQQTNFLKLISYASKFHSKAPKFRTVTELRQSLQRYGTAKVHIFEEWIQIYGEPNLATLEERYREWHLGMKYELERLQQPQGSTELVV